MRPFLLFAALTTLASPALASLDRLNVTQDSATDFTVGYKSRAAINNYWCAAGRFVTESLNLPGDTRVYRLSPPPRKQGQGIRFTLDPAKSAGDTGLTTFGEVQDGGISASFAQSTYCNMNREVGK